MYISYVTDFIVSRETLFKHINKVRDIIYWFFPFNEPKIIDLTLISFHYNGFLAGVPDFLGY